MRNLCPRCSDRLRGKPELAEWPVARKHARHRDEGERFVSRDGYVYIKRGNRMVAEHREVMEGMLGRKLIKGEMVRHRNGDRADNSVRNLELWYSQPAGQRVEDLAAYLVEFHSEILARAAGASRSDREGGMTDDA